jgi:spermidine dehydrogenase
LQDLGVDIQRFYTAFDRDYYDSRGLGFGIYFDRARYGVDRVVRGSIFEDTGFFSDESNSLSREDAIAQMPISENAQRELLSLYSIHEDRLPDVSVFSEPTYLKKISYRDFLAKHMGVTEPEVFALYQDAMSGYSGVGIDASSAFNHVMIGLPGLAATGLGRFQGVIQWIAERSFEPYIFHFPDGNASVARLLVRSLIPGVASGSTMEDIVTQRFDYSQLDAAENPVRIRLGSTAVDVRHVGETASAKEVEITYIRDGRSHRARARRSVLACYGTMIPYICSGLPEAQRAALASEVRVPLVYTNVLLRNWRAFEKIGIQFAYSPGRYHHFSMLDFPVSIGDYEFSKGPDDPIVMHMSCALTAPNEGLTAREQHRKARYALLSRSFEEFECEIREHLAGMLAEGGFDPSSDIRAITVNRWPHGYAYDQNTLFDPEYEDDELPFVVGRKRFGRVTIANSDAGGEAYLDSAIDQAHRAVEDFDD